MYVILHALFISQEYWGKAHRRSAHWKGDEHSSTSAAWICSFLCVTISHSFLLWCFYHPLEMIASHSNPALLRYFPLFHYGSSFGPIFWIFPSALFPLFSFSHLYFSFFFFFLRIIHSYLSSQSPFRQQPLIFLLLVCYIKVSKRVVRQSVSSVIYDYCSRSGITWRTEQNTKISRETKGNVKCHKPLVSKGSLQ